MELPGKLETAFAIVLSQLLADTAYAQLTIARGLEAEDKALPMVTFHCSSFQEEPDQTGNGFCEVAMLVRSTSDRHEDGEDPRGDHEALLAAVGVIWRNNLHALLAAAVPALTVEEEIENLPSSRGVDKRGFLTTLRWRLYAYNVALTA